MCACPFTGRNTCHCAACHATFTGVAAFDAHQRLGPAGLACLDPAAVRRRDGTPAFEREPRRGYWRIRQPPGRGHPAWNTPETSAGSP